MAGLEALHGFDEMVVIHLRIGRIRRLAHEIPEHAKTRAQFWQSFPSLSRLDLPKALRECWHWIGLTRCGEAAVVSEHPAVSFVVGKRRLERIEKRRDARSVASLSKEGRSIESLRRDVEPPIELPRIDAASVDGFHRAQDADAEGEIEERAIGGSDLRRRRKPLPLHLDLVAVVVRGVERVLEGYGQGIDSGGRGRVRPAALEPE